MTVKTEPLGTGAHLLSKSDGFLSRETVTLLAGTAYAAGSVLGKITASGKYTLYDNAAADGTQVASAVRTATAGAAAAHFADAPKGANPSPTHSGAAGSDAPAPRLPNATKAYGALNKPATV